MSKFVSKDNLAYIWSKIKTLLGNKVDKVSGKGLSANDYTTTEKTKLAGIAEGAEVNVQSDWNATSGDAFIKNKPTLFSGNYNDLTNKPTIPTNNNQLTNGAGYITSSGSITGNAKTATTATNATKLNNQEASYYLNYNNLSNKPSIPSLNGVVKLTGNQTISGTKTFSDGINLGSATKHSASTGSIGINGDILNAPNLNDITQRGIYHCTKGTNTPTFDNSNSQYDLMVFNSSEEGVSLVTQMVNVGWKWWIRRKDSSSWGAWERFGQSTTPNNGKLTIQKNGTQVGTFTANQSGNSTINIQAIDSNDTVYKFAQEEYNKSVNNGEIVHKGDITPKILYEGATNGNLTLSDYVENYDYIEIFYDASNSNAQNSMKIRVDKLAIGTICLFDAEMDTGAFPNNFGLINHYKTITIREKTLSVVGQGRLWKYYADANSVVDPNNNIWIHTILGYKEV
jgi:hypothetical protein